MTEAIFKGDDGLEQYVATAALVSGQIVILPTGQTGIVAGLSPVAIGDVYAAYTEGIFDVASATGTTFAQGARVYWDDTNNVAVGTATAIPLGIAAAAKASGPLTVSVILGANKALCPVVSGGVTIAFNTSGNTTILNASQNKGGMDVSDFYGVITTVCAGASQDQLIVGLYDSDDNEISTLTVSDAGADAVGDLVPGTLTTKAALGTVLAVVPAGKGAYVKVKQATSGAGAAGAMRVKAVFNPIL